MKLGRTAWSGLENGIGTWAWRLPVAVVAVLLCLLGVQLSQAGNLRFDVFDEGAHFDYVEKLSAGDIPAWGDTYSQETMLVADCLNSENANCFKKSRDPNNFPPNGGYSYEAQQPPLGYVPFVLGELLYSGTAPAFHLNKVRDFGGTIFVGFAGALLLALSSRMKLKFVPTVVLFMSVLLAPISIHAFSTVNNDSATLVASIGFVLALTSASRASIRVALVLGVCLGLALALIKPFMILLPLGSIIAVGFFSLADVVQEKTSRRPATKRGVLVFALSATVASALTAGAFSLVQAKRSTVPAGQVLDSLLGFQPKVLSLQMDTIWSSFANLANQWVGVTNGLVTSQPFFTTLNLIFLLLLGGTAIRIGSRPTNATTEGGLARLFFVNWIFTISLLGLGWPVLLFLQGNFNFDAPSRYGLLVLPLAATAISSSISARIFVAKR
jgi:hypothetical protein